MARCTGVLVATASDASYNNVSQLQKVKSAIEVVVRGLPSKCSECLRQEALLLLQNIQLEKNKGKVKIFSKMVVSTFEKHITLVTQTLKAVSSKQQKIWSSFHQLRFSKTLCSMWHDFILSLALGPGVIVDNMPLQQAVFDEVYKLCVQDYLLGYAVDQGTQTSSNLLQLTSDELNVVRYIGGYVGRSLLQRYEKMKTPVASQFVHCLGEMAVEGEGGTVLEYSRIWIDKVNRGSLYPINDQAFSLCANIERCIQDILPQHLAQSNATKDAFQKKVHDKILADSEVLFYWTLLSQDILEPKDSEELLKEFVKLWVTVRGFALAASWMELYKNKEKKNTQKSTGLRKSISGGT